MTARDELAALLYNARWVDGIKDGALVSDAGLAEKILADGYARHRTITTTAEVDALPDMSIAMTPFGDAWTIYRDNTTIPPESFHALVAHGPATVLYEPGAES